MAGGNQITFGVGFNVNESNLNKLKQSLQEIQKLTTQDISKNMGIDAKQADIELRKIRSSAIQVETALQKAFNTNLGTINITKFNAELQKLNIPQIITHFNNAGSAGQRAFNQVASAALSTNLQLKQSSTLLDQMKTTLSNTVKWSVASGAINRLTRSVFSAFNYVKALDSSLTDIRIVTGQSREEMAQFAVEANNAAQALGRQTKEYTNAALAFYQQGLNDTDVRARTEATLKAQNVTNAGAEMADYLTAVWNAFQVSAENTELYVDKLAAVADSSASNLSELALAMSKVASSANNLGVDVDQLAAQISTIIATTRQAPQTVGNALKTIYARINDIKSGSDEAEISLGNYTKKMNDLGISVLDSNGRLRSTGEVMEEIGAKWSTMTKEQQIYLAQTMAGQRQMNNLIALFDNWQKYSEMLNVSLDSQGALNEKNARYMESLSAHINQFKATVEGFQGSIIDSEIVKDVVDFGTSIVKTIGNITSSIGGMGPLLVMAGGTLLKVFSSDLASSILRIGDNINIAQQNLALFNAQMQLIKDIGSKGQNNEIAIQLDDWRQKVEVLRDSISSEELQMLMSAEKTYVELTDQKQAWEQAAEAASNYYHTMTGEDFPQDVASNMEEAIATENTMLQNMQDALTNADANWEASERAANKYLDTLNKLVDTENQLDNQGNQRDLTNQWVNLQNSIDKVATSTQTLFQLQDDGQKATHDLNRFLDEESQEYQELTEAIKEYQTVRAKGNTEDLHTKEGRDAAERLANAYITAMQKIQVSMQGTAQKGKEAAQGLGQQFQQSANDAKEAVQQLLDAKQAQALLSNLLGIVGALGSLAGAGVAINNIVKLWNNDSLTSSEKLLRTLQSIGFILPMISSNLTKIVRNIRNFADIAKRSSSLSMNLSAGFKVLGQQFFGVAAGAEAATASFASIAAAAGVVVIALAAIIGIVVAVYRSYNALNIEAEKVSKTAEKLASKYQEVKDAFDELKSSLEDYNAAKNAIEDLTIGTQEWYEAIEDVNNKVLELIQNYPQLAQYVSKVNGQLIISAEGQEAFLAAQKQRVTSAQTNSLMATYIAREAQNAVTYQEVRRSTRGYNTAGQIWQSGVQGATSRFGNVSDADIAKVIAAVQNNPEIMAIYEKVAAQMAVSGKAGLQTDEAFKDFTKIAEDLGFRNADQLKAILDNTSALNNARDSIQTNTKANEIVAEQIAHSVLSGNKEYEASEYQGTIDQYIGSFVQGYDYNSRTQQMLRMANKTGSYQQIINEYLKLHPEYYNAKTPLVHVGTTGSKKYTFQDSSNQGARTEAISLEDIVSEIVYNQVQDTLQDVFTKQEIAEKVSALAKESPALLGFVGGLSSSLADFSLEEIDSLFNETGELKSEYIESLKIDPEKVKQAVDYNQEEINKISKNLYSVVANEFNNIGKSKLSLNAQEALADVLNNAFIGQGRAGMQKISSMLSESGFQSLSKEMQQSVLEAFAGITKDTSITSVENWLKGAGTSLTQLGLSAQDVIEIFNLGAASFETIAERYASASKILNGLNDLGTISADDHQKLLEAGLEDLDQYFIQAADGSYILTGEIKRLKEILGEKTSDEFERKAQRINELLGLGSAEQISGVATVTRDIRGGGHLDEDAKSYVANQLDYLSVIGYKPEQVAEWKDLLAHGDISNYVYAISKAVKENANSWSELEQQQERNNQANATLSNSIDELETKLLNGEISGKNFAEALDYVAKKEAEAAGLDFEEVDAYVEYLMATNKALGDNKKAAYESAIANMRLNKGIQELSKNWKTWKDALEKGKENPIEYGKAMKQLKNATADLLNVASDDLSNSFFMNTQNMENFEKAAEGDAEAVAALRAAAFEDIVQNVVINTLDENGNPFSWEEFQSRYQAVFEDLQSYASQMENGINITPMLNDASFLAELNNMIAASGMTAEQVSKAFQAMGMDTELVTSKQPTTQHVSVPAVEYEITQGRFGLPSAITPSLKILEQDVQSTVDVPAIKTITPLGSAGGNISTKNIDSGKGGGGGGKSAKPEKYKPKKIDPYHRVNIQLGQNEQRLDRLQKDKERTVGKDTIENLRQQMELLNKHRKLLKEKMAIAEQELERQKQIVEEYGFIIDEEGNVINYAEILAAKQAEINALVEEYNALLNSASEEELENIKKRIDELKEQYETMLEDLSDYEATVELKLDLDDQYRDDIDEQIQIAIEAFNVTIKIRLDMGEAERDFNEFRKKVIDHIKDDDYGGQAAAAARDFYSYINPEGSGQIEAETKHLQEAMAELQKLRDTGWSDIYGDNLSAAMEDVQSHYEHLMSSIEAARELADQVHDNYIDALNAMQDAFDKQTEMFDSFNDYIDHNLAMLEILHNNESEANYDERIHLYDQQIKIGNERITGLKEQQDYWKEKMDALKKAGKENTQEYKIAYDNWSKTFNAIAEATVQNLQKVQQRWEESVDKTIFKLKNQAFGGDLQAALDDWDHTLWYSDRYLDNLDRANGLIQLQGEYTKLLNGITDPKLAKQIADYENETLDALSQKVDLREIDLNMARAQLDILKAQIALEDAQQAKTKLRLRRDSQGNYTYQYVADEDNILQKQQEYMQALQQYRTTAAEAYRQDLQDLRDYTLEYFDKLRDIYITYGNDEETRAQKLKELDELYYGEKGYIVKLAEDSSQSFNYVQSGMYTQLAGIVSAFGEDTAKQFLGDDDSVWAAVKELLRKGEEKTAEVLGESGPIATLLTGFRTGPVKEIFGDLSQDLLDLLYGGNEMGPGMVPEWETAIGQMADTWAKEAEEMGKAWNDPSIGLGPLIQEALKELEEENEKYRDSLEEVLDTAGITTEGIVEGLEYVDEWTQTVRETTEDLITTQEEQVELCEDLWEAVEDLIASYDGWVEAIEAVKRAYEELQAIRQQMIEEAPSGPIVEPYEEEEEEEPTPPSPEPTPPSPEPTPPSPEPTPPSPEPVYQPRWRVVMVGDPTNKIYYSTDDPYEADSLAAEWSSADPDKEYTTKYFNTGGYTGEWPGIDGKLAFLHQKELVLNADDTKNMLNAVNITRTIFDRVAAMNGAAMSGLQSGGKLDIASLAGQTVLQNVTINADFPAVADAAEIKQAFNDLINLASQRASGNRRTY